MLTIFDKGNGRNFIGWKDGECFELVKEGGRIYLAELKFDRGLCAMGNPLVF
jgi:hypothetical protein